LLVENLNSNFGIVVTHYELSSISILPLHRQTEMQLSTPADNQRELSQYYSVEVEFCKHASIANSGGATGGQEGAIAPGRQRERAPKEGGFSQGRGDKYDICPRAPKTLAPPLIANNPD
jgi:hypothetical protein